MSGKTYFHLGAWAMPDVLPCITAAVLGTISIGGDPVVGVCVAGVAGGLGFLHSNFQ